MSAFEFKVPANLKSGVYAARLRTETAEDYVPFFVRPKKGSATRARSRCSSRPSAISPMAAPAPQASNILSAYAHHTDGSGIAYSSRLRPITNMRPKIDTRNPWQFMADTHLVDWLEVKGYAVDVITDQDLHFEGAALLAPYKVVLTGTHPEYYSQQMLDALHAYLEEGGRLMYLGGNGFYWVTPMDPSGRTDRGARGATAPSAWQGAPGESHHALDRRARRAVALPRPPAAAALRRRLHRAGLRPQLAVPADARQLRPARRVHLRRHRRRRDHRRLPVARARSGAAGLEIDRVDYALGTPPHTLLLAAVVRALRHLPARGRGDQHVQLDSRAAR